MNQFVSPDFAKNYVPEANMLDEDFEFFQSLLLKLAGISLSSKKRDLVKTRLGPYIRKNNFDNFSTYRNFLSKLPPEHSEWQRLVNLMTTNKTDFFREQAHFDFIEEVMISEWVKAGKKEINIWSSASSSGEEAYTLAMFLDKKLPSSMKYRILATDIDTEILSRAENGVYPLSKEAEIPEEFRIEAIDYGQKEVKEWFRIKKHLKAHVTFKKHNLIEDSMPVDESFDLILCRNVMIYFPKDIVASVANKLHKACNQDGYLFIGHSESLQASKTPWQSAAPSVYKKTNTTKKRILSAKI